MAKDKKLNTINRLQNNGFLLKIDKLPKISYWCQDAKLPLVISGDATLSTPLQNVPLPGDKLFYDSFKIQFNLDEDLYNFKELYKWQVAMAFPQDRTQYEDFVRGLSSPQSLFQTQPKTVAEAQSQLEAKRLQAPSSGNPDTFTNLYSRAFLQFLDPHNKPKSTVILVDIFPVMVDMQSVQTNVSEPSYLTGVAEFKLQHFYFLEDAIASNPSATVEHN